MRSTSQLLTVREAASALRRYPDTIRRKIATGELRAVRVADGGPLLVPAEAVDELLRPARGKAAA